MKNYKLLLSALMLSATLFSCDDQSRKDREDEIQRRASYIAFDSTKAELARIVTKANLKPYKVWIENDKTTANSELLCDSFTMISKTSIVIYSNGSKQTLFGDAFIIKDNLKIELN